MKIDRETRNNIGMGLENIGIAGISMGLAYALQGNFSGLYPTALGGVAYNIGRQMKNEVLEERVEERILEKIAKGENKSTESAN